MADMRLNLKRKLYSDDSATMLSSAPGTSTYVLSGEVLYFFCKDFNVSFISSTATTLPLYIMANLDGCLNGTTVKLSVPAINHELLAVESGVIMFSVVDKYLLYCE